jgi:glycosyltransferase involved in cell wall biosynthesis
MPNKNKVVFFTTSTYSVNAFCFPQIVKLSQHNYRVYLICGSGDLEKPIYEYLEKVFSINSLNRKFSIINDCISFMIIIKILLILRPNLIIYATPKAALLGSVASFVARVPNRIYQIWGIRWQNLTGLSRFLVRCADFIALKLSTKILAVSNSVLSYLRKYTKFENMEVLGLGSTAGIDTNIFYYKHEESNHKHVIKLGYAGRIAKDKGIEDLVTIFEIISHNNDYQLELIGDLDKTDPISPLVIKKIKDNPNIIWINNLSRDELAVRMRNWKAQIFLSRREGLGNVILEAGACGVPTFCWKITGTVDAMPDFCNKFIIDRYNETMLKYGIEEYLGNPFNEKEKQDLSNWYTENFNQELVMDNFLTYVEKLEKNE